jgi:hypothetical protein
MEGRPLGPGGSLVVKGPPDSRKGSTAAGKPSNIGLQPRQNLPR